MTIQTIAIFCTALGAFTAAIIPAEIWLQIWNVDPAPLASAAVSVFIWLHAIQAVYGCLAGSFAAIVAVALLGEADSA